MTLSICTRLLPGLAVVLAAPAMADVALTDKLAFYGDARSGYFHQRRDDRDGEIRTSEDWRLRVRTGLKWRMSDAWEANLRVAGRYSTEQDGTRFRTDWYAGTDGSGMSLGESTVDVASLSYSADNWSLKAGRFQTGTTLMGVAGKSLDRNDSNNTEIHWTDGIQWQRELGSGWRARLIAEYNDRVGPSNVKRRPLSFQSSDSHWSGYAALENNEAWGPVVQRGAGITWLPSAVYPRGQAQGKSEDYLALMGRTTLQWPMAFAPGDFLLGMEAAYAPETPRESALNLPGSGDSDGLAWQVSFNWMQFAPGHSIGLVAGRAGAGWLLSTDFVPNSDLLEVRYQWKIDNRQRIEIRLRRREDLERPLGAIKDRESVDGDLRYTFRW